MSRLQNNSHFDSILQKGDKEGTSLLISPHPEEMLTGPKVHTDKSAQNQANPGQFIVSLHPEEYLNIPLPFQPDDVHENEVDTVSDDVDIFSDESL